MQKVYLIQYIDFTNKIYIHIQTESIVMMTIDIRLHFCQICLELQNPFTMWQNSLKISSDLVPNAISNYALTINSPNFQI